MHFGETADKNPDLALWGTPKEQRFISFLKDKMGGEGCWKNLVFHYYIFWSLISNYLELTKKKF